MSGPTITLDGGDDLSPEKGRAGFLFLLTFVAAMGGLLFGYDWVVIGGAAKFYEAHFHLQDTAATISASGCSNRCGGRTSHRAISSSR